MKGFVGGFGNQWANLVEPLFRAAYAETTEDVDALELAGPIREHRPDLVVHGHAHHGSFEGSVGDVPVYNVAVHVMRREFWLFELGAAQAVAVGET